ncbi:MAG TPA: hypothetical protein VGH73_00400 [Thermoanaerobaculia bacterium]
MAESLVAPPALDRILPLARQLPGDALAALEARLAPEEGAVDLSLRLTRSPQALELAERFGLHHLRPLLLRWAEEGEASPVGSLVETLWLEFDLGGPTPAPRPVVCAGLRGRAEPGWIAGSLLPGLHGEPLSGRQRTLVEACCAAIPEKARLLYAFSLGARGAGEVRLEILGLDPQGVREYMEQTAPHAAGPLAAVLPLFEGVERLHLSLDIGERISPRVGVEGSFRRLPHREPRWRQLFDLLVARGLCSPEKRDAVFVWPGHDSFWTAPEAWPAGAARLNLFCVRSLSHVKLVCSPGREPEAKVYLLFTPFERRRPGRPQEA